MFVVVIVLFFIDHHIYINKILKYLDLKISLMALWFTTPQLGTRRDIQITNFHTNQNFTVRKKNLSDKFLFLF